MCQAQQDQAKVPGPLSQPHQEVVVIDLCHMVDVVGVVETGDSFLAGWDAPHPAGNDPQPVEEVHPGG